ncbi:MAG: hypothetical protein F6K14_13810 [Symploca sp. SIO2C1]|nr:hypothetical protein [Symploca sp. SIO2C1]
MYIYLTLPIYSSSRIYEVHFLFPIPDSRFPIPNSRFPIPDSQFPIPDSQFPIPHSPFPKTKNESTSSK